MIVKGTNISMIRGDSESITVSCRDKYGKDRSFNEGDIVYFTVKSDTRTERKSLQKIITEFDDGKAIIEITPSDTKGLEFRKYVYDIQLTEADGNVTTIIPPSDFEIRGEVTYE